MKRVGAHVSIAGGVGNAPLNAAAIGAKAFGLFVKNQLQWKGAPLRDGDVQAFRRRCREEGFEPGHILAHDGYLINLGSPERQGLERSREAFLDEMRRCEILGIRLLNFHPGSTKGLCSEDACLARVAESVNLALAATSGVTAVIENTAGQGGCVGHSFEQIARIIEGVVDKTRVGVCLDTCHLFAAGHDLRTRKVYERTMERFGKSVGFGFLRGMHLNDARSGLGSRVDRHESIGGGQIGLKPFGWIMKDPRLEEIPLILETPDGERWAEEIGALYGLCGQPPRSGRARRSAAPAR